MKMFVCYAILPYTMFVCHVIYHIQCLCVMSYHHIQCLCVRVYHHIIYEAYSESKYRFAVKKIEYSFVQNFIVIRFYILQTIFPHIRRHY